MNTNVSTYGKSHGRTYRSHGRGSKYVTKGYLRAIVGSPETKWVNLSLARAPISTTFNPTLLNSVPQGTGQSQRIGDEVTNKSVQIRLDILRGAVDSFLRVILFWALDGSTATPSDILETQSYQSPLNKNQGKSFWVKFDKTYALAAGQSQAQVDEIWRQLKCKTEYEAGSIVINQNSLYLAFISDQATTANQPQVSFTSRVVYLDM